MTEFKEKTSYLAEAPLALIIGCGDMGMGCARALGRRHPLMIVDIDAPRLEASAAALRHEGYTVATRVCDIADREQVAALGAVLGGGPGVKVLAHVAAIGNDGTGWQRVIRIDLIAARLIADAVGPHMVRGGVAIFVSSTGAQRCAQDERLYALLDDPLRPDLLERLQELAGRELNFLEAYFMAKRGVNQLAEKMALAWGPREVRSLSLSPGLIESTMGRTGGSNVPIFFPGGEVRLGTRSEKAGVEVPLGRQGSIVEVIAAIDFLASDAASFINGIDVPVDGGSGAYWKTTGAAQTLAVEHVAPAAPVAG